MKKSGIIFTILTILLVCVAIYFLYNNTINKSKTKNYEATKSSLNQNNINVINNTNLENSNRTVIKKNATQNSEKQLATFSTKIYNRDSARQNNIQITCKTLNDTIIPKGETFSFCSIVGQATTAKGYQEADIFDRNGNKKKGLGGGNCQISSTLYNAVLSVPTLEIIERHPHSNSVPYVPKDKDAAVAYGSYDFKFKNNSGKDLKISVLTDGSSVTATITALSL